MKFLAGIVLAVLIGAPAQGAQDQGTQSQATPPVAAPAQATAAPAIDPAKEADIRQLLDIAGTTALVDQLMDRTIQSLKPVMTNSLPAGNYRAQLIDLFFAKFRSKFDTKRLLDLAIARYNENFSDDEIKGLIAFYQTPLGHKVITVLPSMMAELQGDGQKMGQEIGRGSMMEVLQEHPELAQALQEAAARRGGAPNQ
ncbi:MAG TPA: DUF2059 domain-containing protein [Candidatus Acidoferrum sp.]|nr:DUF2059 domain-containing protein [Candidatus Acidoferrum sp.]